MNCETYNHALTCLEGIGYEVLERNWKFEERITETRILYQKEKEFILAMKNANTETQKLFAEKCAADPKNPDITVLMMNIYTLKTDPHGKRYLLFFCQKKESISNDDIRRFFSIVSNFRFHGGLFVYHGVMKKQAQKIYTQVPPIKGYTFLFQSFYQLKLFSLRNNWAPKVVRVEEKGKEFLEKNKLSVFDCPKIHSQDFSATSSNAGQGSVLILENNVFLPGVAIGKTLGYAFVV